ncbi:MAG: hypothetical protein GF350_11840 [Chitinivibrionales bacterium]|nr:hypothetical protein [Chitinivibrionales bacterium]
MIKLPSSIRIRVKEEGGKGFGFRLPMWLFWIPLILLYIVLIPLIIIADIVMKCINQDYRIFTVTWEMFPLLAALRGLDVHVWNEITQSEIVVKIS